MTEGKPDWSVLMEDLDCPMDFEERASRIAAVLSSGEASPLFQKMLSEMINPSGKHDNFCLKLHHSNAGRPKGPNWAIGFEMVRLIDEDRLSIDEARFRVVERFGVNGTSRTTCLNALKAAREVMRVESIAIRLLDLDSPEK